MPVGPRPILQQVARDMACAAMAGRAPAPHVIAQGVDQRKIVAFLLGQQRELRRPGALGLVPVAGFSPMLKFLRRAGLAVVFPMRVGLIPRIAQDRVFDRLNRDFLRHRPTLS
jgi:hypothetical protein